jgi:hypothetical protein
MMPEGDLLGISRSLGLIASCLVLTFAQLTWMEDIHNMATITAQLVRLVKGVILKLCINPATARKKILVAVGVIVVGLVVSHPCPAPEALNSAGDGIPDTCDKWPAVVNQNQADTDRDSLGNTCDLDLNDDGQVDGGDVYLIVEQQGQCSRDPSFSLTADLDSDGCVDAADLDLILTQVPISIDRTCAGQADAVTLALLVAQYRQCLEDLDFDPVAPLNGDGCVDGMDVRRLCMSTPRMSE